MTETAVHPEARAAWAKRLRRLRRALVPHRPKAFRDSLNRWLLMGTVIGIVSGIGAIIFFFCLETGTHYLLETLGGYTPPGTLGEGDGNPGTGLTRPWAIPLVVTGGALVSSILVYFVAPTAKGHGTDNAIHAVHHDPTALRGKVAVIKIIASSLMIGSGGSGGREGPTAQISATAISSLCKKLKIATPDARIAVSAATASGIGAIFRAPLGGALLGAELLYRDDLESDAIMPSLVSSIVAFVVFGSVYG
ncbi:MAG: chloride channel protein, partial [Cutibacterium avidum]|nr:chloride channel protein [Cutibacterium avidum]